MAYDRALVDRLLARNKVRILTYRCPVIAALREMPAARAILDKPWEDPYPTVPEARGEVETSRAVHLTCGEETRIVKSLSGDSWCWPIPSGSLVSGETNDAR